MTKKYMNVPAYWEYMLIPRYCDDEDIQDALESAGQAGWELAAVDGCRLYLKRAALHPISNV